MNTDQSKNEMKSIDEEIEKAISTITELEGYIKELSNNEGKVKIDQKSPIKDKYQQLNIEVKSLTKTLLELGFLEDEDI